MKNEEYVANVLAALKDDKKPEPKQDQKPEAKSASKPDVGSKPKKRSTKARAKPKEEKFPVEPRIIQVIKKPKTFMNHSYRDFSAVPPEIDYEAPSKIEDMSFSEKVHHILSTPEYKNWICWCEPHGRAFRILVPKLLEKAKILQKYFGHNRYSSFLRQLNNYGFKHITHGPDRNCYYHEFMLRGMPHLCRYMPEPRDARRLMPDPENEPDFLSIHKLYPIPDENTKLMQHMLAANNATATMKTAGVVRLASQVDWLAAAAASQGPPTKLARLGLQGVMVPGTLGAPLLSTAVAPSPSLASAVASLPSMDVARARAAAIQNELKLQQQQRQRQADTTATLVALLNSASTQPTFPGYKF